jgi:hypothetical protein
MSKVPEYQEMTLSQIWFWLRVWLGWKRIVNAEPYQVIYSISSQENLQTKQVFQNFTIMVQPYQIQQDINRQGLEQTVLEGQLRLARIIKDINTRRT